MPDKPEYQCYDADYSCPPSGNLCVDPCDTTCITPPTTGPGCDVKVQGAKCIDVNQYNCACP